ncbi:hypothetical protein Tco_1000410 [Tanacetum coccineum]
MCGVTSKMKLSNSEGELCNAPFVSTHRLGPDDFVVYCDASKQEGLTMRKGGEIEISIDYECEINYHPGKANVGGRCLEQNRKTQAQDEETLLVCRDVLRVLRLRRLSETSGFFCNSNSHDCVEMGKIRIDFVTKLLISSSGE